MKAKKDPVSISAWYGVSAEEISPILISVLNTQKIIDRGLGGGWRRRVFCFVKYSTTLRWET